MFENIKTPVCYVDEFEHNKVWMLREDMLPFCFGGNKVRIADKLVQDFKQSDKTIIVGYGNARSNLSRVLVNLCASEAIKCCLIAPRDDDGHTEASFNSNIVNSFGIEIFECEKSEVPKKISEVMTLLKERGEKPYYIYSPHHVATAVSAYAEAFSHISEWEKDNLRFDRIFLACGTGTTLAGLLCGEWLERKNERKITGISIARKAEREIPILQNYVDEYCRVQGTKNFSITVDMLDDSCLQGVYGTPSQAVDDMVKKMFQMYGIPLDSTYTGKAFYSMLKYLLDNDISGKNILFLHTGGTPLFFDRYR